MKRMTKRISNQSYKPKNTSLSSLPRRRLDRKRGIVSLEREIIQLLNHFQSKIGLPRSELESICVDLSFWQPFLQTISSGQSNDWANALQTQIEDLAHNFECMIESYKWDWRNRSEVEKVRKEIEFFQQIVEFKQKINLLTKTMVSEKEKHLKTSDQRPSSSFIAESDTTKMAERDEKLEKLKKLVLGGDYPIISIVGMAGIGKTTLAKELFYNNPTCLDYFQIRLFFIVGHEYEPRQFLLLALSQLGFQRDEMGGKRDVELEDHLRRYLYGKMYLIVLDDIWDAHVWHQIELLFPNNKNGSRIIMTTRIQNVTGHPSSDMLVPFLNADESWDLLRNTVFTSDQESSSCDYQLEKIGRKIAKNCEGLPLAIIEVGKLLCRIERKVERWKEIAEREDPIVITIDDGTPISKTISLSYKMLPQHLKSCFLYMGVFPKDYEIRISKLIKLWVSEEFIEKTSSLSSSKSLEKIAEDYLLDLILRSLVLVCKRSSRGGIKTCRIHFVFRNICISEARNEKLFHVIKKYPNSFPNRPRGLVFHNNILLGFKQVHNGLFESVPNAHSLLCFGPQHQHPLRLYLHFPLLRVLDAVTIRFYKFPHEVVELVKLRYLTITYDAEIPPSISALCDLEVLIVRRHHESLKNLEAPVYLPMEIWKLHKLRHLQCMGYDLRYPSKVYGFVTLENLSVLSGVSSHSCNRGVLQRIPILMKLVIRFESPDNLIEISDLFRYLRLLKRLESFKCIVVNPIVGSQVVAIAPYFPTSIRKITLSGCGFSWRDMTYFGSIPNLQVLKLRRCAFRGAEWETNEYEFMGLEVLLLEDLNIEQWITHPRHFPNLKCLIIRHCYKLREIPLRKSECFSTLEMIEVDDCRPSLVISAQRIQEEQQRIPKMSPRDFGSTNTQELEQRMSLENKSLELRIHHSWDDKRLIP